MSGHTMRGVLTITDPDGYLDTREGDSDGPSSAVEAHRVQVRRLRDQGHRPAIDGLTVTWTERRPDTDHTDTYTFTYTDRSET